MEKSASPITRKFSSQSDSDTHLQEQKLSTWDNDPRLRFARWPIGLDISFAINVTYAGKDWSNSEETRLSGVAKYGL